MDKHQLINIIRALQAESRSVPDVCSRLLRVAQQLPDATPCRKITRAEAEQMQTGQLQQLMHMHSASYSRCQKVLLRRNALPAKPRVSDLEIASALYACKYNIGEAITKVYGCSMHRHGGSTYRRFNRVLNEMKK